MLTGTYTALGLVLINKLLQNLNKTSLKYPSWCPIFYLVTSPEILFNVYIGNACLMTKVGLNVLLSINQSVSHHNIMLLLPYVSQLSNVTRQLKDIYGLRPRYPTSCDDHDDMWYWALQEIFLFYIEVEYLQ
jgi:hypothetical protein